jgi:hypothetical protein
MVEQALYHKCIGGTVPVPPLVMEMQTGRTKNHISKIFSVFAPPMYWCDWLAASNNGAFGIVMFAAPALIDRSMTNY